MKVVLFGLGSIGQRHGRLLREMGHEVVAFRSVRKNPNPLGIPEVTTWEEVDRLKPEVAFITTPTARHLEFALPCAEREMALFIEKPIDASLNSLDKLLNLVEKKKLVTYVAYVLRFHPVIRVLKEESVNRKIKKARLVSRSYLPDWRPGQNHLNSYSARRDLGGGALLDVSHEFDLAQHLFGPVREIVGRLERRSDVTVDAEDYMEATVKCPSVNVEILIDIASRKAERTITIETDQGTIAADLMQETDRDAPYRDQLRFFFDNLDNPKMMNNIPEAAPLFHQLIAFREKSAT